MSKRYNTIVVPNITPPIQSTFPQGEEKRAAAGEETPK